MIAGSPSSAQRFVLDGLRAFLRGEPLALSGEVDWTQVGAIATRQKILPFLARALTAAGQLEHLPPMLAARWTAAMLAARHELMQRRQLLTEVARVARDAGVALAPMKGAALSELVYRDAPYRHMADVDVLVKPGQAMAMIDALRAAGFAPLHVPSPNRWHDALKGPEGWRIDLALQGRLDLVRAHPRDGASGGAHVDVHVTPWYRIGKVNVPLDVERAWRGVREHGGDTRLGRDDVLRHLLLHAAEGWGLRLVQLLDLALLLKDAGGPGPLDWLPPRARPAVASVAEAAQGLWRPSRPGGEAGRWYTHCFEGRLVAPIHPLTRARMVLKRLPLAQRPRFLFGYLLPSPQPAAAGGSFGRSVVKHWARWVSSRR